MLILLIFSFFTAAQPVTPELQNGDLIFQTSSSKQSYAIMWASKSLYSHVGIIEVVGNKKYVIEAVSTVRRTPLEKWIARGRLSRYAVYRYEKLNDYQKNKIITETKRYLGRGYDIFFTSLNKQIYCSELVSLAFTNAGLPVGKTQKIKELDFDNMVVRSLVQKRWRKHPLCQSKKLTFEQCWDKILDDTLVSPESVAQDTHLNPVFTNYPI
jgi:hypothetical protein